MHILIAIKVPWYQNESFRLLKAIANNQLCCTQEFSIMLYIMPLCNDTVYLYVVSTLLPHVFRKSTIKHTDTAVVCMLCLIFVY